MFLIPKKGSLLLLMGIGLLLSTVPPSGTVKCYGCRSADTCEISMAQKADCIDRNADSCEAHFHTKDGDTVALWRSCATPTEDLGCRNNGTYEICRCNSDLCNTDDISELRSKEKGSKSGGGSAAGTLLFVILGSLVTAREFLPGSRNTE